MADVALAVQSANFGMPGQDWLDGARPLTGAVPVVTISHHLAHAYSAFGGSDFTDGHVLITDGCGNALDDCIDLEGAQLFETLDAQVARTRRTASMRSTAVRRQGL